MGKFYAQTETTTRTPSLFITNVSHKVTMKKIAIFSIAILSCFLSACGKPVPPEKKAYVGEWQEKAMYLLITQDGSISYKRLKGGANVSVEGPLQGFTEKGFDVGVGPMSTTFVVNKPPFQEGGQWKMVVDDIVLTKTSN